MQPSYSITQIAKPNAQPEILSALGTAMLIHFAIYKS
jgi:hypothetical protein